MSEVKKAETKQRACYALDIDKVPLKDKALIEAAIRLRHLGQIERHQLAQICAHIGVEFCDTLSSAISPRSLTKTERRQAADAWRVIKSRAKTSKQTPFEKTWSMHLEPQLIDTGNRYADWFYHTNAVTTNLEGIPGGDKDSALERRIEISSQWTYIERQITEEHGKSALFCTQSAVLHGKSPAMLADAYLVNFTRTEAKVFLTQDKLKGAQPNQWRKSLAVGLVERSLRTADDIWTDAGKDRYVGPKVARGEVENY